MQVDNQPVLLLRIVDHCVDTGWPKMWLHAFQVNICDHCSGNVVLSKTKKWAYFFDDVLVHDVCWSIRRNWGYPSTKDTGIGAESVDPLIWRPWESLFPLLDLGQWCCCWWQDWELVGRGWVTLMWFKVGQQACSHSRAWWVLPRRLTTWGIWWWETGWRWRHCWSLHHCNWISRYDRLLFFYHRVWKGMTCPCVLIVPCRMPCTKCLHWDV